MDHASAAHAYREDSFENAPPLKIVRLMYEGAIKNLERARRVDPQSDGLVFNESLSKADAIICELRFSLDAEASMELAKQLEGLYLYAESCISEAFAQRSVDPIEGAVIVLRKLHEAWRQLDGGAVEQAA